ncbi:lytic murein transglycosylase B [Pollutimonas harenae]|uniref:Lytic murein transglycosylase B n=1 Tax=Pollutimonas harenae TaxID=657015 RepID=A0A853H590_9BURK|nr:lytic murein transglycosylase B [Pollutimonas harenae]NYT85713.1 lytic murein transglycosylase B [Pollutimonas harenae]TEA70784.1 lytic murein transglycosylase B [Pollutimonas harenae]
MFKPARILQVVFFNLLLVGCASTQNGPSGHDTAQAAAAAAAKPETASNALPLSTPEPAPSIQAGRSIPGNSGFLQANGQLTDNIQAYANEVARARGIPLAHVEALLKQAQYNATAAKLMTPSKTRIRRSWVTYRKRFVEPVRINAGTTFWTENKATLDRVASQYGVPPSIIVAIIGVETVYGRVTGNFKVLDALATLGFRYPDDSRPERSQLFRDQLADLIQLDYENKLDASQVEGSFAGAMGLPQFMPGSLMRYAADGNNDGRIDLLYSTDDAIASVARFLRLHGWVPGLPVFAPASLPKNPKALVVGGLYPTLDWSQLQDQGARFRTAAGNSNTAYAQNSSWTQHKLGIVDLLDEPRNLAEYRVGTPNFFAITHYNRSYFYASSVADLAQALADRVGYGGPN